MLMLIYRKTQVLERREPCKRQRVGPHSESGGQALIPALISNQLNLIAGSGYLPYQAPAVSFVQSDRSHKASSAEPLFVVNGNMRWEYKVPSIMRSS